MKSLYKTTILVLAAAIAFATSAAAQSSFKLPAYQQFKLPNGLTVYIMEQHEVPLISVSAIIAAGAINDGEQHGLAALTARNLKAGTKSYTKAQIEEKLDFVGADLFAGSSKEFTSVYSKFASKDLDVVLPILGEVISAPTFPADEFDKQKKLQLAALDRAKQSPRNVILSYWDQFIFGDQPYGNSVGGSPQSVAKITGADLRAFYNGNYAPQNSAIAIVGDINPTVIKLKLGRLFSTWKASAVPAKAVPEVNFQTPKSARVLLVNKDDAKETTMYIGGPGIKRNNPDFVAVSVINTLFGGRFTSMLNDELRVNSGLTYGASSVFSTLKQTGTFYITTFTAAKTTAPTIEKAVEIVNKLHKDGINETSLASAKNYVKGQFPPRYETSDQLARLLTEMFWYNFDSSFINNFEANVDKLDLPKARTIIEKYFPKNNLQYVLIGKAADIKPIAEKYGTVTEKQIKTDGF